MTRSEAHAAAVKSGREVVADLAHGGPSAVFERSYEAFARECLPRRTCGPAGASKSATVERLALAAGVSPDHARRAVDVAEQVFADRTMLEHTAAIVRRAIIAAGGVDAAAKMLCIASATVRRYDRIADSIDLAAPVGDVAAPLESQLAALVSSEVGARGGVRQAARALRVSPGTIYRYLSIAREGA